MKYSLITRKKPGRPKLYKQSQSHTSCGNNVDFNLNISQEPIDLCFEKNFINKQHLKAAWHFRWLYSIRYGLPLPTSMNLLEESDSKYIDYQQKHLIEQKYLVISRKLDKEKLLNNLLNFIIYREFPNFLIKTKYDYKNIKYNNVIYDLRLALDIIIQENQKAKIRQDRKLYAES